MNRFIAILLGIVLFTSGCGNNTSATTSCKPAPTLVFAAASLTSALTELETQFEAANPCTDILLSFGSSSTLATQISQGASAQVFISASSFATLNLPDEFNEPQDMLANEIVVAFDPTKTQLSAPADLALQRWARCVDEAPCGSIAVSALAKEGVSVAPTTLAQDATALKQLLLSGEIEAALLYHSDVVTSPNLTEVRFADRATARTNYPVTNTSDPIGQAWVAFLQTPSAAEVFTRFGFEVIAQ